MKNELIQKIESKKATIGVIGLGYVGLPLLIEFYKAGFKVMGFDTDREKVCKLKAGKTYIKHIPQNTIHMISNDVERADYTDDFSLISTCDAVLICVPTPLSSHREPDLSFIRITAETIGQHLKTGQLVILESTTYPGTTEEVLAPILEETSQLVSGKDFFVAYSPEREDPNNPNYSTSTIPKVVGGINTDSLEVARSLYNQVISETVPVSNCRTAEATKLLENIFRCINIALVNELKVVFNEMKIDIWETIDAASTKPFGFMPFYPGPGLGGHCIPIDPFYLTWKAREFGITTKFIELAGEINAGMPDYVIHQALLALNEHGKSLKGSRVLLVGLAYKKNVDDARESPTFVLWKRLEKHGAEVDYYDPYCPAIRPSREHSDLAGKKSISWEDIASDSYDLAIIATAHDCVDHDDLAVKLPLVLDTRGACRNASNVYKA